MSNWTRQKRATHFFRFLLKPWIKSLFAFQYDPLHRKEGPMLILANHNTDLDPVFLGLACDEPLRYVASEHIVRKGFGSWFLKRYFDPILITKGTVSFSTVHDMIKTLKEDHSVVLFPEGNRSFNGITGYIPPVTGKLVKTSRAALVTYRFEGGYFTQPRWGSSFRKGRLKGVLAGYYSPEDLKKMSADEITDLIRRNLYEDAYKTQSQEPIAFSGKNYCSGLEALLYRCPDCQQNTTLKSDSHRLSCSCGFCASLDAYGMLIDQNGNKSTLTDLAHTQRSMLQKLYLDTLSEAPQTILFSDQVSVSQIDDSHNIVETYQGELKACAAGFYFNEKWIPFDDIQGAAIHSRNTLTVHIGQVPVQYEITGSTYWNALKYIDLYHIHQGREVF